MNYTIKQIKCILRIQEFIEMCNTLSKVYNDFDDRELSIVNIADKNRIYKLYCASIYNSLDAIKQSKDIFGNCEKYSDFEKFINKEFSANDEKYYENKEYKANFFRIIKTIRKQVNHFNRDEEDDNVLFEIYIDSKIVDELRLIINEIFYEIYNKVDKKKIEIQRLSKPKIKYSFDRITDQINLIEQKLKKSTNEVDKFFSKKNEESIKMLRNLFSPNNLYNLLSNDEDAIKNFKHMEKRVEELFEEQKKYIDTNGTKKQKEAINLIEKFVVNEPISKNNYNKRIKKLKNDLDKLAESNDE